MEKKINICIDFNKQKPLSRWHCDIYTNNFFNDNHFRLIEWNDFKLGENNFLFLYCVPNETLEFLQSVKDNFYQTLKKKKIKLLFWNEQFNLFMFDRNIFQYNYNIKHNCYDINDILYWKILNIFKKHNIEEEMLFFIHGAKGFLDEIKEMSQRKILWINSTLNLKSKHIQTNSWLSWGQGKKILMHENFNYHYACLFSGRPAAHRHNLLKKLWQKKLLNFGKCSLTPCIEDDPEFNLVNLQPHGTVNLHAKKELANECEIFQDIFLWIAGETYCPNNYPWFTEKTVKPIIYERPFISYGNPGTLNYLREYGFKTFGDFWDESYDDIKDDNLKIEMIAKIIENICKKNLTEIHKMYDDMRPIIEHNKNLLINTNWRKDFIKFLS